MRIKKKEVVIPFTETLAFRMILLSASAAVFIVSLVIILFRSGTTSSLVGGVAGAAALWAVFYNLSHLRDARIPKQTLNKMKRR